MNPRLPADYFPLQQLASRSVQPRLKMRPSRRSFCSSQKNQASREKLILCSSTPLWTPKLHHNHVHRAPAPTQADLILQPTFSEVSFPTSDVVVWTNGFVPSPLGAGGAGIHAVCARYSSFSSLSNSAGPISSSFSAESFALVHGLEWCHYHLKSCHFQSALFLTDSQSASTLLSKAPAFLQPKFFWDISDLSDSLSSHCSSKLPMGPRSCWTSRK